MGVGLFIGRWIYFLFSFLLVPHPQGAGAYDIEFRGVGAHPQLSLRQSFVFVVKKRNYPSFGETVPFKYDEEHHKSSINSRENNFSTVR